MTLAVTDLCTMAYILRKEIRSYRGTAVLLWSLIGVCSGCCAPKNFFGPVRVLMTTVAPGMPQTSLELYLNAYDADNKRVAVGYKDTSSGSNAYTRNILDFGKGIEYLVQGAYLDQTAKCTKYPLRASWKEACVPANSTQSAGFYMGHPDGQYYHQMNAWTFTHVQRSVTAKVMVTQDLCALTGEVVYDSGDPTGVKVINRLYVNQTTYANPDFFNLPQNITCVPDPNPPAMTPWQRMGLFGWLLGMPDN